MNTSISRRSFVAALGAATLAGTAASAQAPIQLRISTAAAETDWLAQAMRLFKDKVEAALPGQMAVQVHTNASLFRQGTEVPALQRGNLEMSTMTTFEVEQQIPEYGVFSAGYLFRDADHMGKVMRGDIGRDYAASVAQKMGIEILDTIYLGTRQTNLRKARDVKTPADLAGIKLRMPPGPGWTALGQGLGATPTAMPIPEVYLALKTGAIDGQENPLPITRANNFHEVTEQMVMTSHLVQPVFIAVAKPVFDKLTEPQKAALRAAAKEAAHFNDSNRVRDEAQLVDFFRGAGLKIATPDLDAFRASVGRQYEQSGLAAKWVPGLRDRIAQVS